MSTRNNLSWGEVNEADAAAWQTKRKQLYQQQRTAAAAGPKSNTTTASSPAVAAAIVSGWWERTFGTSESRPRSKGHPAALPLTGRDAAIAAAAEREQQYRAKWQRRRRRALILAAIFGGVAAVVSLITVVRPWLPQEMALTRAFYTIETTGRAIVRIWRDVSTAVVIGADYTFSLMGETGASRQRTLHRVHERCAQRLADMMRLNGGVYIKFGQHIAQLQHLLPDEYVQAMQPMLNQCPRTGLSDLRAVFISELGATPEQLFRDFDPIPIASASLAQVHIAHLHSGEKVAVKIQHRFLDDTCIADLATVTNLVEFAQKLFPSFDYQWLVNEVRENLPLELDFTNEARNSERCNRNFRNVHDVVTPEIVWPLTSKRVLTMEFMEGCKVNDLDALARMGVKPSEVAKLLGKVFGQQIFIHGFVHCDPHAGNVLINLIPGTNKPQIVLLDHGLYRELTPEFRLQYAMLWRSIIFGDVAGIKTYATQMNCGDLYPLFAAMLTHKPWHDIERTELDRFQQSSVKKDQLQAWAVEYMSQIQTILSKISRPMILLLKTNDTLRSLDTQLGTPVNSFVIMARYCEQGIEQHRAKLHPGVATRLTNAKERVQVEWRLLAFQTITWFASTWRGVTSWWSSLFRNAHRSAQLNAAHIPAVHAQSIPTSTTIVSAAAVTPAAAAQ